MTNLINGMSNMMDSVMSMVTVSAGLEILQTALICIGFIKVVEVIYKIAKYGYTNERGATIVGCGVVVGIGRVLPDLFNLIVSMFGV